ncbi:MAG: response regulator [Desulfobulbaceae bacterium]|nr:MAG: response regulator [Desulfobulbaceae bacterium]
MPDILVIDDDDSFRSMLCKMLARAGYSVLDSQDGRRAAAMVREHAIPLVVTDLIMPDQEGIETIIQLRREFPDVKIVAISGGGRGSSDIYLDSAMRLGATRCFAKPFKTEPFLQAIRELLPASSR